MKGKGAINGLTLKQSVCLTALASFDDGDGFNFVGFRPLSERTGLDVKLTRRIVRQLSRKGLAKFQSGLWTDEGEPAGSGYGITDAGHAVISGRAG